MTESLWVNGKEFKILKLLGKGKGGYSYLAENGDSRYVLKQIHHEPCEYYSFGNKIESEIRDYKRLKNIGINLPIMIDADIENERILKEYIDGSTISELVAQDAMKPEYYEQIRRMCALLYQNNTNIDYYPTNFIVQNGELYYIDYECNDYMARWSFENWGIRYWSKVKAVIFDMYETLVTLYNSPQYFGMHMALDAGIPDEVFQRSWRPTEDDRTLGKLTLSQAVDKVLKNTGVFSKELSERIVSKRIESKEECFRHIHPEIIPMLKALKNKGIKVGLISNCFSEEAAIIRESELFPYFDVVCMSYELGMKKPDADIYLHCLKKLGLKPYECLYVGDGGSHELEAASKAGMQVVQAVWYLKEGTYQPVGRMPEYVQMESPSDILRYVEEI